MPSSPPPSSGADSEPRPDSEEAEPAKPVRRKRVRRRVTTQPVPGSDPTPQKEPPRYTEDENDFRLRQDKPPHWG
jgi:hypothetical protein